MKFVSAFFIILFASIANVFSFFAMCFLYLSWVFLPEPKPPFEWFDDWDA
jgi:hypothetical protein